MNSILVCGGSGFLGAAVAKALISAGHSVTVFDRESPAFLLDQASYIKGDITNPCELESAVQGHDIVYNFAAIADLNEGLRRPVDTVKVNILGNALLLDACVAAGVKKFIYASTVYVNSRDGGFYRCSKVAAEDYVREYSRRFGLDYCILRYGSLYGPGSDSANGLFRIVSHALDAGYIKYPGSPHATREYIHIYDAASASVKAIEDEFSRRSVVLTGHEPMKVVEMLEMLAEILGGDYAVEFDEREYEGHYVRTPYSLRSELSLKYKPPMHVDMGQGLIDLVAYVQAQRTCRDLGEVL